MKTPSWARTDVTRQPWAPGPHRTGPAEKPVQREDGTGPQPLAVEVGGGHCGPHDPVDPDPALPAARRRSGERHAHRRAHVGTHLPHGLGAQHDLVGRDWSGSRPLTNLTIRVDSLGGTSSSEKPFSSIGRQAHTGGRWPARGRRSPTPPPVGRRPLEHGRRWRRRRRSRTPPRSDRTRWRSGGRSPRRRGRDRRRSRSAGPGPVRERHRCGAPALSISRRIATPPPSDQCGPAPAGAQGSQPAPAAWLRAPLVRPHAPGWAPHDATRRRRRAQVTVRAPCTVER